MPHIFALYRTCMTQDSVSEAATTQRPSESSWLLPPALADGWNCTYRMVKHCKSLSQVRSRTSWSRVALPFRVIAGLTKNYSYWLVRMQEKS